jgi:hypothetical protein
VNAALEQIILVAKPPQQVACRRKTLWARFETESILGATTAQTGVSALTSYWR